MRGVHAQYPNVQSETTGCLGNKKSLFYYFFYFDDNKKIKGNCNCYVISKYQTEEGNYELFGRYDPE